MSGIEPEKYKELIVDIFAAEYDAWVMREKAKWKSLNVRSVDGIPLHYHKTV